MCYCVLSGAQDERRAPEGLLNVQGAGATIARENATARALIANWRENATARGRRERAGTETGTEETGEKERGGDLAAPRGTKSDVNAEGVAAAAGTEGTNEEIKRGTEGMTGAGGRTGITTKTGGQRENGPGIKRAGERLMTGDIKRTGRGTERRGRPNGPAGVEAERRGTKVEGKRKAGSGNEATAEKGTGIETENSDLTDVVVAKTGATISESPVMIIVNTVNADGVRALSNCRF